MRNRIILKVSLLVIGHVLPLTTAETNPYCSINQKHYLCDEATGDHKCPDDAVFFPTTEVERSEVLKVFNEFRSSVASGTEKRGSFTLPPAAAMSEMKWSKLFEASAFFFINECSGFPDDKVCCECQNIDGFQVRAFQLVSNSTNSNDLKIKKQLQSLLRNGRNMQRFTLDILQKYGGGGRFDPIVYTANARVSLIGCAQVVYTENLIPWARLACVMGSISGLDGDPIYETGDPCTKCRVGATCSERYRNLCSCEKVSCKQRLVNAEDACRRGGEGTIKVDQSSNYTGNTNFYDTDDFKSLGLGSVDLLYSEDYEDYFMDSIDQAGVPDAAAVQSGEMEETAIEEMQTTTIAVVNDGINGKSSLRASCFIVSFFIIFGLKYIC